MKTDNCGGTNPLGEFGVASPENKPDAPPMPPHPEYLRGNMNQQSVMNPATVTTSYIPTPFIVPPEIKVGENWYIKLPGAIALVEVEILEVTKQTVVIKQSHRSLSYISSENRYKKSDIEFIEKSEERL